MVQIHFKHFTIGHIKDSSAVFSGDNFQQNFSSVLHKEEGSGSIIGDQNIIYNNKNTIKNRTSSKAE